MRIAVLADIHGNIVALEAVLAHIAGRTPDLIVNLGDCAAGPLWPRETMDCLMALGAPTVRGNHDRWMATLDPAGMGLSDRFAYGQTSADHNAWLGALPLRLDLTPDILALHGTPSDDNSHLLDAVENGRVVRDRRERIAERLGKVDVRLVLCGHSHRSDVIRLPGGPILLNPGSVGCPAYESEVCVFESGAPHARYAMIERLPDGDYALELVALPYNHEKAAQRAEANSRPEWAQGLRFGFLTRPP